MITIPLKENMKSEDLIPASMKIARELMCDVFLKCSFCDAQFDSSVQLLEEHLKKQHKIENVEAHVISRKYMFICPLCDKKDFILKGHVILHIVEEHTRSEAIDYIINKIKANPEEYLDPLDRWEQSR